MALKFLEGFDHFASGATAALSKWSAARGGGTSLTLTTGRFGNGWSGSQRWIRWDAGENIATWYLGAAFQLTPMGGAMDTIIGIHDSATLQCVLTYNGNTHQFQFKRGDEAGTNIGSAYTYVPAVNQWEWIEVKFVIDQTTGEVVMKHNGVEVINATSLDTAATANEFGTGVWLGSTNDSASTPNVDDLYVADGVDSGVSGAPCNTFLGDIKIEARLPDGNGNSSQLVGQDGNSTDNYLLVDETNPDDETTYVETATVNNKDTYTYQNLATTAGTVWGLQILPRLRKTDAGVRSAKSVARLSGTEVDGPTKNLGATYAYMPDIRHADPAGNQWTISNFNSAEFGIKVTA